MRGVVLILAVLAASPMTRAQSDEPLTPKRLQVGISLGIQHGNLASPDPLEDGQFLDNQIGHRVGVLADYRVKHWFHVVQRAEISDNHMHIRRAAVQTILKPTAQLLSHQVHSVNLELSTHGVVKAGQGKSQPYLLVGPNLRLPVSKAFAYSSGSSDRVDVALDMGFGWSWSVQGFTLAPGFRYSYGLLQATDLDGASAVRFHNMAVVFSITG